MYSPVLWSHSIRREYTLRTKVSQNITYLHRHEVFLIIVVKFYSFDFKFLDKLNGHHIKYLILNTNFTD